MQLQLTPSGECDCKAAGFRLLMLAALMVLRVVTAAKWDMLLSHKPASSGR